MDTQKAITFRPLKYIYDLLVSTVNDTMDIFEFSFSETLIWLNAFQWNYDKFTEFYTSASETDLQLRQIELGIRVQIPATQVNAFSICPVCMTNTSSIFLSCGHTICRQCFEAYVCEKAPEQVFMKCFYYECKLIIPYDVIEQNYQQITSYKRLMTKQFARENKSIRPCDNKECDYCVLDIFSYKIVECVCRAIFCLRCSEGDHRPADCDQARKWRLLGLAQDKETLQYIRNSTKFCPKCRQPIEKNQGCNHMICKPPQGCGHEFCWLCLEPWQAHSKETGGNYVCNSYQKSNNMKKETDNQSLNKDKSFIEKLIFYSVRFEAHDKAENLARAKQQKFLIKINKWNQNQNDVRQQYSQNQIHKWDLKDMELLQKCFIFLIKARRILKWTYCYGYYFSQSKKTNLDLFEFNQADFERGCETLHYSLEAIKIKKSEHISEEFGKLLQVIQNQRISTEQFMEKFLKELND